MEGIKGKHIMRPHFLPRLQLGEQGVVLASRTSLQRFWKVLWHLWIGGARHPEPSGGTAIGLEALNVGSWLTHGDTALETSADFLAVSQHRLILASVRAEWPNLSPKGIHSVWAPACQDGAHVGHAGVGVVCLKGDPIAMPSFATTAFRRFFDLGRLVRYVLPLGNGRLMHW